MSDVCGDTLPCYNSSRLTVTVSEDEVWQRNAAVGECPVSCGDGKTDRYCCVLRSQSCIHCSCRQCFSVTSQITDWNFCNLVSVILCMFADLPVFLLIFQLFYTGIVIYAPALILNQGRGDYLMALCMFKFIQYSQSFGLLVIFVSLIFG